MAEQSSHHTPRYLDLEPPTTGSGDLIEIADGVFWASMPVNDQLAAINIWLLRDHQDWAVMDTGWRNPATLTAWRQIADRLFNDSAPKRVFCTHMHPDHSGLSGWLSETYGARLHMTRLEYFTLRMLAWDVARSAPQHSLDFYRAAGLDEDALDRYRMIFGEFGRMIYPMPDAFNALAHGEYFDIGGVTWQVVVGSGHSPEHACFYSPALKLFVSGDQVLPRITSNVSVYPYEPDADPLTDWLFTLERIKRIVPDDVLVLPAHGKPFHGLHDRIDTLIAGHEKDLVSLHSALEGKEMSPAALFPVLYSRPITNELSLMAAGETLAHLACLRTRGFATVKVDAKGVQRWTALPTP